MSSSRSPAGSCDVGIEEKGGQVVLGRSEAGSLEIDDPEFSAVEFQVRRLVVTVEEEVGPGAGGAGGQ